MLKILKENKDKPIVKSFIGRNRNYNSNCTRIGGKEISERLFISNTVETTAKIL
jgi:hypothetical protein